MTERIYYNDPYRAEFERHRRRRSSRTPILSAGIGTACVLDRTAFYPTSGGQPFDTGTLGAARVVDVVGR